MVIGKNGGVGDVMAAEKNGRVVKEEIKVLVNDGGLSQLSFALRVGRMKKSTSHVVEDGRGGWDGWEEQGEKQVLAASQVMESGIEAR